MDAIEGQNSTAGEFLFYLLDPTPVGSKTIIERLLTGILRLCSLESGMAAVIYVDGTVTATGSADSSEELLSEYRAFIEKAYGEYPAERSNQLRYLKDFSNEASILNKLFLVPFIGSSAVIIAFFPPDRLLSEEVIGMMQNLQKPVSCLLDLYLQKEFLREDAKRLSMYLSGLINEVRTPLNALSGFTQLMREPASELRKKKYLDILNSASSNMINLIGSFGEIAAIETGTLKLNESIINIEKLTTGILDSFSDLFKAKGIEFRKKISLDDNENYILSDEAKLIRIVEILLSNALENTFTGVVTLSCSRKENRIEFCVADTGMGLSKEKADQLFKYQGSGFSSYGVPGKAGLGLIIAKLYAEFLIGKIWFVSDEGKGSEFYVSVPFKQTINPNQETKSTRDAVISATGLKRILVAEDDDINFTLIKNFLDGLGTEIIRAENGSEAVNLATSDHFDLILMDIRMPVMDGYTASRILKSRNPSLKIIAQTAYSDKSVALANGCDDFITKPYGKRQLLELVASYIGG